MEFNVLPQAPPKEGFFNDRRIVIFSVVVVILIIVIGLLVFYIITTQPSSSAPNTSSNTSSNTPPIPPQLTEHEMNVAAVSKDEAAKYADLNEPAQPKVQEPSEDGDNVDEDDIFKEDVITDIN